MDKAKIVKGVAQLGKTGLKAGAAFISSKVILDNVDPILKIIHEVSDKFKNNNKVVIPALHSEKFHVKIQQAKQKLENVGLKADFYEADAMDTDIKYRNCVDGEVIYSEPSSGQKVAEGSIINVKYITQEIIDASNQLYKEQQEIKNQAAKKRAEKIAGMKEKARQKIPKVKQNNKVNIEE